MDAKLCLLQLCDESLSSDPSALSARIQRLEERIAVLPMTIRAQANLPIPEGPPAYDAPTQSAPAEEAPPWEEPPLPDEPPVYDAPPWEEPPLPEEPPMPAPQPVSRPAAPAKPAAPASVPAKPAAPAPAPAPSAPAAGGGAVWQELAESCKGKLPPMYRVFLDKCRGSLADGVVTVYAPDDMTMGRLNNDRVLAAFREQGEKLTGTPVQVRLQVGMPAGTTPEQLRENLIQFGSKFDNIIIK
jgi:DNA polymerase-3 subunit gamma/tau